MARTPVVGLDAEVVERLEHYVAEFAGGFGYITRTRWAGIYLPGLFLDGERKSIEPLSRRVSVPGWHGDTEQALQQFVNQSIWDEQAVLQMYRRVMGEAFDDPDGIVVIDDTGFAKKGRHSVGVARQYSGTLGKTDNCQVAVSLHYAAAKGDYPLALRLFLPDSWTSQPERMEAARVPVGHQAPRTKNEIALDLLDQLHTEGLPYRAVVADAGYGIGVDFRRGLDERGVLYVVGIAGNEAVLTEQPTWSVKPEPERGRPPKRWYLRADAAPPVAVKRLAETLERTPLNLCSYARQPGQLPYVMAAQALLPDQGPPAAHLTRRCIGKRTCMNRMNRSTPSDGRFRPNFSRRNRVSPGRTALPHERHPNKGEIR